MINDELDGELMKIEAVADVLATLKVGDLAGNTLPAPGAILEESCEKDRECTRGERQ